jgi:hypothetical protein
MSKRLTTNKHQEMLLSIAVQRAAPTREITISIGGSQLTEIWMTPNLAVHRTNRNNRERPGDRRRKVHPPA